MNKKQRKKIGKQGEQIALKYYQQKGWQKIAQNCRSRSGELDLLLQKNGRILVVEVKTRQSLTLGWGEESVDDKKLEKIRLTYEIIRRQRSLPEFFQLEICVIYLKNKKALIKIFPI
ncbi:MAG: YraN family protein [Patescibacteria group bacterium]|nr:YraN family protein [Patescibacteria group bacterium]